jgi:hypothetical protein
MSDVTLNQLAELPATVTNHAAQIADLHSRLAQHEQTLVGLVNRPTNKFGGLKQTQNHVSARDEMVD